MSLSVQPVGQRAGPIILLLLEITVAVCHFIPNPQPRFPPILSVSLLLFGNIYIRMRDELGTIYTDEAFAPLFPVQGKPALAPACLVFITNKILF